MDVHTTNYTLCAMEPIIGEDDRVFATIKVTPDYKNILMFIENLKLKLGLNDEYDIQHHIHQTGQNQEHQRRPGVAQRADNAGQQIIQHGGGNAKENHPDIIVGVGEGLLRGVHPAQNGSAQGGGRQRDNQSNDGSQPDHVAHEPAKALKILLTELLGHGDGKAGADTVAQSQHQKVDGAGRANARQRVYPQKFTNHDRIHHAVKLLKQQAKQQRQHKGKNQLHGRTHCQITSCVFCHTITSKMEIIPNILFEIHNILLPLLYNVNRISGYFSTYGNNRIPPMARETRTVGRGIFLRSQT